MRIFLLLFIVLPLEICGQSLLSPSQFLGYELGTRFTPHSKVLDYFEYVDSKSELIELQQYGETYEHRPLMVALVSSPENLSNKEQIRTSNLHRTGLQSSSESSRIPIVWLSYNVHGNEAVSTEASMETLYQLVSPNNPETKTWLRNTLVIMDPCINPDGRDRYVNWYNQVSHSIPNPSLDDREHREPWPRGRSNHYMFDLNRDWAWQTQIESQKRIVLYNQWFPQVHVDFHEQGLNRPYYFAPAAEPYHELITPWQREFQHRVGENHARYFHREGWLYFTKEVFDLLYPSYGDSYPMFNGSIGMTYEQGGSSRAGLQAITENQDTLTLKDRIAHHHTTGLSTIEVTSKNAEEVIEEFTRFFRDNQSNPPGKHKSFVVKGSNDPQKIKDLCDFLDSHLITYGRSTNSRSYKGYSYLQQENSSVTVESTDLVISAYQPKSVLTQVLFDAEPKLSDSLTYDITSWALPYQFQLEAYALTERINLQPWGEAPVKPVTDASENAYAYIGKWKSLEDARWLSKLLLKGIKVRFAEEPFTIEGQQYDPGSLVITKADNRDNPQFGTIVAHAAKELNRTVHVLTGGWAQEGSDLGARSFRFIERPQVALLSGVGTSSFSFGEFWHFFEQQLNYPVTIIDTRYYKNVDLDHYQVLILPSGNYDFKEKEFVRLKQWIRDGGRLVVVGNALNLLAGKDGFALQKDTTETESGSPSPGLYKDRRRESVTDNIPGAIFKVTLDASHPLGFGYDQSYFSLKTNDLTFPYLDGEWNVGTIADPSSLVSGFVGYQILEKQQNALALGVEEMGSGAIIYMVDNPLFRAFWYNGKMLVANSIFFVGQ